MEQRDKTPSVRAGDACAVVTNPVASLEAIFNTLPLAGSDITLPMELGVGDTVLSLLLPQQLIVPFARPR